MLPGDGFKDLASSHGHCGPQCPESYPAKIIQTADGNRKPSWMTAVLMTAGYACPSEKHFPERRIMDENNRKMGKHFVR